jgi:hypothetical protein
LLLDQLLEDHEVARVVQMGRMTRERRATRRSRSEGMPAWVLDWTSGAPALALALHRFSACPVIPPTSNDVTPALPIGANIRSTDDDDQTHTAAGGG